MAEDLPPLQMDTDAEDAPIVIVGETTVNEPARLADLAPGLLDPRFATAYAQLVNHLSHGFEFELILDPAAYEASYRAAYEAEDPEAELEPGEIRLRSFGLPEFGQLTPPAMAGETLVFYARHTYYGTPYRVVLERGGAADYQPVAMTDE